MRPQPVGAVIDGVHRGHHGQQHLGGADVRGRLLAADVLLAGLQRQAVGGSAGGVHGDADQTPRQRTLELVTGGEEAGVGSTEAERHPETLRGADHHVGAQLARRGEQGERQQVCGDDEMATARRDLVRHGAQVADLTRASGVLDQRREALAGVEVPPRVPDHAP